MPIWSNDPTFRIEPAGAFQDLGFDPTLPLPLAFLNWKLWDLDTRLDAVETDYTTETVFSAEHDPATGKHTDINADTVVVGGGAGAGGASIASNGNITTDGNIDANTVIVGGGAGAGGASIASNGNITTDGNITGKQVSWAPAESRIVYAGHALHYMISNQPDWGGLAQLPGFTSNGAIAYTANGITKFYLFGTKVAAGAGSDAIAWIPFNVPGDAKITGARASAVQIEAHTAGGNGVQVKVEVWKYPAHIDAPIGAPEGAPPSTSIGLVEGFDPVKLGEATSSSSQQDVIGVAVTATVSGLSEVINPDTEVIMVKVSVWNNSQKDLSAALYSVSLVYETTQPGDFS